MTILVISHAHPDFSIGGAEIAAYNLFASIKAMRPETSVILLARSDLASGAAGAITIRRRDEYLWRQDMTDWFYLRTAYPNAIYAGFRQFLLTHRPDTIFVHHYAHIGIEMLREIKRTLPQARLVLTLHEFVAICNRNGQMLKATSNRLCYEESPDDCHRCFPAISAENFWLRKHYVQKHFGYVDAFVSPSQFLLDRYVQWGIDPHRSRVIENGQKTYGRPRSSPEMNLGRIVFGFFGQITEFKGLDVLLQAVHLLPPALRSQVMVEVHGANLDHQGQWLKDLIERLRTPLVAEGCLRWAGPYDREGFFGRIRRVDWLIVPSIWWENSPMVIQEAFSCGKPVICSGIGGMAEKVRDGVDGMHFEVANPFDLAEKLAMAIRDPALRDTLAQNIRQPLTYDEAAALYLLAAEQGAGATEPATAGMAS